jgi:HEAT repeat protein
VGKAAAEREGGRVRRVGRSALLRAALLAIGLIGCTPPTQHWLGKLEDPDPEVRQRALLHLGRLRPDAAEAGPGVMDALDDPDPRVREAAARLLSPWHLDHAPAVPALVGRLRDEQAGVRAAAARSLGAYGSRAAEAVVPLSLLLGDRAREVKEEAARALGRIGPPSAPAMPELVQSLGEPEAGPAAARALGAIGSAGAVPALEAALEAGDPPLRLAAAAALWRMGVRREETRPILLDALGARDRSTGNAAEEELEEMGPAALPMLIEALRRPDAASRYHAARAVGWIGPGAREAVPALAEVLYSGKPGGVLAVLRALRGIGPDARAALPSLERVLWRWNGDPDLKLEAAKAIAAIDPSRKPGLYLMLGGLAAALFLLPAFIGGVIQWAFLRDCLAREDLTDRKRLNWCAALMYLPVYSHLAYLPGALRRRRARRNAASAPAPGESHAVPRRVPRATRSRRAVSLGVDLLGVACFAGALDLFHASPEPLERITGLPLEPAFVAFGLFLFTGVLQLVAVGLAIRESVRREDLRPGTRAAWVAAVGGLPFVAGIVYWSLPERSPGPRRPPASREPVT